MDKLTFEDGVKIKNATVTINEQEYKVTPAQYQGKTPLSSYAINKMQENIEKSVTKISKDIPDTTERVWIQRGKNRFNKYGAFDFGSGEVGNIELQEDGSIITHQNLAYSYSKQAQLFLKKNTNYIVTGKVIAINQIYGYRNFAYVTVLGYNKNFDDLQIITNTQFSELGDFSINFNSGDNEYWGLSLTGQFGTGGRGNVVYDKIMVSETGGDYEDYVEDKFFIKENDSFSELINIDKLREERVYNTTSIREKLIIENCAPVRAKIDIKSGKSIQNGEASTSNIIPIRNVGDNENILNNEIVNQTTNGVTVKKEKDESITLNGTSTTSLYLILTKENFKNQQITIGVTLSGKVTFTNGYIYIVSNPNDVNFSVKATDTFCYQTVNKNRDFNNIRIYIPAGATFNNYNMKIKAEYGLPSLYTPYGCGSADFKVENKAKTKSMIVSFPFTKGQVLHEGDYLASDGIHQNRKTSIISGTSKTFSDAKQNANYLCSQKIAGTLSGQTITFDKSVTDAVVEYELARKIVVPYTAEQKEVYYKLQHLLMYEKYTIIECTNEIKPDIQATYLYDNKLNNSYGARLDEIEEKIKKICMNIRYIMNMII